MGCGRAGLAGALGLVVVALLAPASSLAAVACGDSITNDLKLHDDLNCSAFAGDALEIDDGGVTIDLNGHTLFGPASANYGIDAGDGRDHLTVKNGTIEGFYHAIELRDNKGAKLTHLKVQLTGSNDNYGVYAGEQQGLRMSHITVDNASYGFYLYDNRDTNLVHSKITGSDPAPGGTHGVDSTESTGLIDDVQANRAAYGFYLSRDTRRFKITGSTANHGGYGFFIGNDYPHREYTVSHNTANDNATYGFFAARKTAGSGNTAKDNGTDNCVKVSCG